MAKRSDTLETVLFALEMLRRIPHQRSGRTITVKEMQEQLAETKVARGERTIQRQLDMLSDYFEIERDDSERTYRYCWKERARGMELPVLTEQESLLLSLAEQHLRSLLPASLMKSMDGFFVQARANLAPLNETKGKAKREREWLSKVRVVSTTQPLLPPKIKPDVFEQVSNALYSNLWLDIDYENSSGKRTQATVMPLGLAQQGPRFYLVCRFKGFDNERSLALHRIVSAEASSFTFERPKDFDLESYDNDGRFGFGEGNRIKLSFHIGKDAGYHLLESPLSADQQVRELEDSYAITATVVDSAMLEWWLRGFGDSISNVRRGRVRVE